MSEEQLKARRTQMERNKINVPFFYQQLPNLTRLESLFFSYYNTLSTCRAFAEGCVPWDKIIRYSEYHGLTKTETNFLVELSAELDHVLNMYREDRMNNIRNGNK